MTDEWNYITTVSTFLNEPVEVHAFIAGYVSAHEGIDRKEFIASVPANLRKDIKQEYHYFLGGRAAYQIMRFVSATLGK